MLYVVVQERTGRYLALDDTPQEGWRWVSRPSEATWFWDQEGAATAAAAAAEEYVVLTRV